MIQNATGIEKLELVAMKSNQKCGCFGVDLGQSSGAPAPSAKQVEDLERRVSFLFLSLCDPYLLPNRVLAL